MASLTHLVLGPPGRHRLGISQTLLSLGVYLFYALLQALEVGFGMVDADESNLLAATYVAGATIFYTLVRTGWSRYLSADPAMPRWQMWFGVVCGIWSYSMTGPARGAVISSTMLVIVFAMFTLRPAEVRRMALAALAGFTAVMAWRSSGEAPRYPREHELIHFMFATILLGGVSMLSMQMGKLRSDLRRQKAELEHALDQIRLLATRDELTGLVNRRHMSTLLRDEQERQGRQAATMSLALIDIDLFKRINDTHGHAAGDAVLKRFADAASVAMRSTDVLARWGGEEFLLMMPATEPDDAHHLIERIREGLERVDFSDIAERMAVTFSAGLAECRPGDALDAAIDRADQAMYRAKTSGRNCTRTA